MSERQDRALADYWLTIATRDLCGQARARIAVEIEAHYLESVEAHVADRQPLLEARLIALEELGDAKEAARRFKKKHLTKSDEEWIDNILSPRNDMPLLFSNCFVFGSMALAVGLAEVRSETRIMLYIACFMGFLFFTVIAYFQARRVKGSFNIPKALLTYLMAQAASGVAILLVAAMLPRIGGYILLSAGLSPFVNAFTTYRLRNKFQREQKMQMGSLRSA